MNRDIKLQHMLLDKNRVVVKLCDFGFSKVGSLRAFKKSVSLFLPKPFALECFPT